MEGILVVLCESRLPFASSGVGYPILILADALSQPTPPRTQTMTHLPTPESIRRPMKLVDRDGKVEPAAQSMLPTPQTLPRPPRRSVTDEESHDVPSPTGHTTFFLSSSGASGSRGDKVNKRRPGLTFAQQMGLAGNQSNHPGRPGIGVGMGGSRHGGHKKDQIVWGSLEEPVALSDPEDDNPFVTRRGPLSPGKSTTHRPRADFADEDTRDAMPLGFGSNKPESPTRLASGLLTPPPTRPTRGLRTIPAPKIDHQAEERKRKQKEEMRRMMDVESNPFLAKPGESSRSKQRQPLPVDETRPTVTYVFRGSRKVFANPFYPAEAPFPPSTLDPEDEEYEPHPNPKPRLLWPSPPPIGKRINLEEFDSPPPTTREASPPSSPLVATPRRRLFVKESQAVRVTRHDSDDEGDEDHEMSDAPPVKRRLFQPVATTVKRPAEPSVTVSREKRARPVRK